MLHVFFQIVLMTVYRVTQRQATRSLYCHLELTSTLLLISQFVTNQICSHVTDLLSFVSLAFLCNPADFLPDYLFHLQCYI